MLDAGMKGAEVAKKLKRTRQAIYDRLQYVYRKRYPSPTRLFECRLPRPHGQLSRVRPGTAIALGYFGIGGSILQPKSQQWIWMTLAVLALGAISYLAVAPAVIKQATAPAELGLKAKPEKA